MRKLFVIKGLYYLKGSNLPYLGLMKPIGTIVKTSILNHTFLQLKP